MVSRKRETGNDNWVVPPWHTTLRRTTNAEKSALAEVKVHPLAVRMRTGVSAGL